MCTALYTRRLSFQSVIQTETAILDEFNTNHTVHCCLSSDSIIHKFEQPAVVAHHGKIGSVLKNSGKEPNRNKIVIQGRMRSMTVEIIINLGRFVTWQGLMTSVCGGQRASCRLKG